MIFSKSVGFGVGILKNDSRENIMNKYNLCNPLLLLMLFTLSGCNTIGAKTGSLTILYGITAILSLLLLIGYCCFITQKEIWFLLLFTSIFIVNAGYFSLSISKSIEEALLANRISYLGSVFLPMSMLMIILNVTKINYKKWFPMLLFILCIFVFLVAASPGYLDIYYKEVSLNTINGVTVLDKVYGPWHCLYLYYLLTYFSAMICFIVYATLKKDSTPYLHACMLAGAVFINIGVWFIEQIVHIDFELLSVSYIICELFLLGLHVIMLENEKLKNMISQQTVHAEEVFSEKENLLSEKTESNQVQLSDTDTSEREQLYNTDTPEHKQPSNADTSECEQLSAQTQKEIASSHISETDTQQITEEQQLIIDFYCNGLRTLTKTEHTVFNYYLEGKTTKEVMAELSITENTLKFHNKNIYSKLGVTSRKQMLEIYKKMEPTVL